jgi:hypothetical protein
MGGSSKKNSRKRTQKSDCGQRDLEGSRFVVWQLHRLFASGSRELPNVLHPS